jgi:hypothetical protein
MIKLECEKIIFYSELDEFSFFETLLSDKNLR